MLFNTSFNSIKMTIYDSASDLFNRLQQNEMLSKFCEFYYEGDEDDIPDPLSFSVMFIPFGIKNCLGAYISAIENDDETISFEVGIPFKRGVIFKKDEDIINELIRLSELGLKY
jgi:hypothetical protein